MVLGIIPDDTRFHLAVEFVVFIGPLIRASMVDFRLPGWWRPGAICLAD